MGIYLNGIHISRKLSTEKGNYAQRFAYMSSSGFRCRNFRIAPNFIRGTKLRLTTTTAIAYIRCYLLVRFITTKLELERKRFFFSFLCDGKY